VLAEDPDDPQAESTSAAATIATIATPGVRRRRTPYHQPWPSGCMAASPEPAAPSLTPGHPAQAGL